MKRKAFNFQNSFGLHSHLWSRVIGNGYVHRMPWKGFPNKIYFESKREKDGRMTTNMLEGLC